MYCTCDHVGAVRPRIEFQVEEKCVIMYHNSLVVIWYTLHRPNKFSRSSYSDIRLL